MADRQGGEAHLRRETEKKQTDPGNLEINNWLVALAFNFFFINEVIGAAGSSYITLMAILILCVISIYEKKFIVYPGAMILIGIVFGAFLVSFLRVEDIRYTFYYFRYFGGFCIISFLAGLQNIRVERVIAYMSPIGFAGMIVILIRGFSAYDSPHLMGLSYAILPVLLSSVLGVIFLDRVKRFLSIANIIMVLWCFVDIAPRGIWIVVACFMAINVFYVLCKSKWGGLRLVKEVLFILLFSMIALGVIVHFTDIILGINEYLSSEFGIKIYALEKYVFYFEKGNVLNERGEIWMNALKYIQENVLLGKGIGYYELRENGEYAHNLLLQVTCEGGLIMLIPVVFIVLKSLGALIKVPDKGERNEYLFFAMTFSYGVVMLFWSSVYWKFAPFWFFLGCLYKRIAVDKKSAGVRIKI